MGRDTSTTARLAETLRAFGLATYPGAHLKSPWPGHLDLAVNDRTFAYLSLDGEPFSISCKLPQSSEVARMLPFAAPTGYGLGKSGWVTASRLPPDEEPPVELFKEWIDESYRAQAPKKLLKQLEAGRSVAAADEPTGPAAKPKAAKPKAAKPKAAKPKAAKPKAAKPKAAARRAIGGGPARGTRSRTSKRS